MKCPMFETAMGTNGKIVPIEFLTRERECLKEECAWWDNDRHICAVKSIFHDLTNIRIELKEIKDKMPHAGKRE